MSFAGVITTRLYRHRHHLALVLCIAMGANCNLFLGQQPTQPTAPSPIPNVDAGVPPPVVVATPPPEDTTTAPDSGQPLLADIELPVFIVGGDEGTGTVLFARRTDKPITLTLSTSDRDVEVVPSTVAVEAGINRAGFRLRTHAPHADTPIRVTAALGAESRTGTFTLALPRPINRADAYTAISGRPLVVPAPGILANDTRRDGHELTAVLSTQPDHGTLTLSPSGGFTYLADSSYTGPDRFIYRALDGVVSSGVAHVNITVVPPPAPPNTSGSTSFSFTGGTQSFTVPAGVTEITIDASGAQGGAGTGGGPASSGGLGGNVVATVSVTPGETLTVVVGGQGGSGGAAGFNGGGSGGSGGGGSSDVRRGGTALVIAGGGGGGGKNASFTGPAGGAGGGAGAAAGAASGGGGGTQTAGGAGGSGAGTGSNGNAGSANTGGNGGFGTGNSGGGGGGGLFGGGGGGGISGPVSSGGGGGGSSFVAAGASNVSHTQGARLSDGLVVIRW